MLMANPSCSALVRGDRTEQLNIPLPRAQRLKKEKLPHHHPPSPSPSPPFLINCSGQECDGVGNSRCVSSEPKPDLPSLSLGSRWFRAAVCSRHVEVLAWAITMASLTRFSLLFLVFLTVSAQNRHSFSPTCHQDKGGQLVCDRCQVGYAGPRCDR